VIHDPFVWIYFTMPKVKTNCIDFSEPGLVHDLPQRAVSRIQFEKILVTQLRCRHSAHLARTLRTRGQREGAIPVSAGRPGPRERLGAAAPIRFDAVPLSDDWQRICVKPRLGRIHKDGRWRNQYAPCYAKTRRVTDVTTVYSCDPAEGMRKKKAVWKESHRALERQDVSRRPHRRNALLTRPSIPAVATVRPNRGRTCSALSPMMLFGALALESNELRTEEREGL
jgi:hypothetical protein